MAVPRVGTVSASCQRVGWPWDSPCGAGVLGWPPRRAEHWGAALGCRVGAWHGQLGSGGNRGFVAPVAPMCFPFVTAFTCQTGFHHACSQLGTRHRKLLLGQGQAVLTPVPAALSGAGVANRAGLGSELALRAGAVPVEPRPAGPGTVRGSVALGGRAREQLVLVCKNTEGFFFFFLAVFCRQQQGSVNIRLSQQASRSLLAERDRRRGEITVHVWSYRS